MRLMRPHLRQLLFRQILQNIMRHPNLKASVHFSEIPCNWRNRFHVNIHGTFSSYERCYVICKYKFLQCTIFALQFLFFNNNCIICFRIPGLSKRTSQLKCHIICTHIFALNFFCKSREFTKRVREMSSQLFVTLYTYVHYLYIPLHTNR